MADGAPGCHPALGLILVLGARQSITLFRVLVATYHFVLARELITLTNHGVIRHILSEK